MNCIKLNYLRGGSFWSYIDLMMNMTCFMSIFFKYFYSIYVDRVVNAAIKEDKFTDYSDVIYLFNAMIGAESLNYLLIALSMMNVFIVWLPSIFKVFLDITMQFFDKQLVFILVLNAIIVFIMFICSMLAFGPYVYEMYDYKMTTIRMAITSQTSWFWHSKREHFGLAENMDIMGPIQKIIICILLTMGGSMLSNMISGIFIAKVLNNLRAARLNGKKLDELKHKSDMKLIELKIKER